MKSARPRPLGNGIELLESRDVPTTFGIPWADPNHLTLSFVPDGTPTPTGPSTLFQTMNKVAPTAVWEREILRAFESWAAQADIDIGLVDDGGQPLGTTGSVQGDARFGDIRIAAAPLGDGEVAAASPFSWTGTTFSGDVIFNASRLFQVGSQGSGYDLYSVALHEGGHTLGLAHTTAAGSVMQEGYAYHTGPGAVDVQNVQALYGARAPDAYDAARSNNTRTTASATRNDGGLNNIMVATGDLTTAADADYYKFGVLPIVGLTGVTVRVVADGSSLLTPSVTVYDSRGRVVASGQSTDPTNNDVTVHFFGALLGGTYTVKVDGATSAFGTGAYQVAADYGLLTALLTPLGNLLAPTTDGHTNDLLGLATLLGAEQSTSSSRFDSTIRGSIEDSTDVDNYKVHAPAATGSGPMNLNVMVWGLAGSSLNPRVHVFDANGNPVAFQVLANDTGVFSVQVLNVTPGADYYVQVAGTASSTGAYFLGADFNQMAATTYDAVAADTLAPGATGGGQLVMSADGIYEFALSAAAAGSSSVTMTVKDAAGNAVLTLTAAAGQPTVTSVKYLKVGTYTITYTAAGGAPVDYGLYLLQLSDGVGPYTTTTTSSAPPPSGTTYTSSSSPSQPPPPPPSYSYYSYSGGPTYGYGYSY
jgi:hypothetical protein